MMENRKKIVYMVQLALLTAIIVVMAFTPLGYLKVGLLEITFLTIPVIIGAVVMGPVAGAVLGGVFGITSLMLCFGANAFGAMLLSINPVYTVIVCIVPRVLMGFLCGWIFRGLAHIDKTKIISYVIAGLSGALLNTAFFMGGIILFFGKTDYIRELWDTITPSNNVLVFIIAFVGVNGLVEAITCGTAGALISKVVYRFARKNV